MVDQYRTALQVSPERIANLDDAALNELMRALLLAQAYLCGANISEVVVNTDGNAADNGADGMSPAPARADPWLGDRETAWQFKAGDAGQPARLAAGHEVLKPLPRAVLERGGRFCVVASGSTAGERGEQKRLEALVEDATTAGIPATNIVVWGSESLTNWCNQHPAIAARWAERPSGLSRFSDWARSDEHDVEWQPVAPLTTELARLRAELDLESGSLRHIHIFGQSGVGKTRFALELCREATWQRFVIYIRQASDQRLSELLDSCVSQTAVRLVVVADEVQQDQIAPLRDSVGRAEGRVRLVTIGPTPSPDPGRIPSFEVMPLPNDVVAKVVQRWHPGLPAEHAEFVAQFADGYIRLARLAANAVHRNPAMDVRLMLEQREIRGFLNKMLGDGDRRSLYVVAALTSVGWTADREVEGRAIAEHLGLEWSRVRSDIEAFERTFHIVPRSGRLRNISPKPLGIHLALEAWDIYPNELRSLPAVLPEAACDAYFARLEALASSPQAGTFSREELLRFFPAADLNDSRAIRRWSAFAHADPTMAAASMRTELSRRSAEDLTAIRGHARLVLVDALVALAWSPAAFENAVHGLALLADAENDAVFNNATAEFLQRFSLYFSGTAVPYVTRVRALDELSSNASPGLRRLSFRALARVATQRGFRIHRAPICRGLPEPEWEPESFEEHVSSAQLGLTRMLSAVERGDAALQDIAGATVGELHPFLLEAPVRAATIQVFIAAARAYPTQRETLRRIVSDLLYKDRRFWHRLGDLGTAALEALLGDLEDRSIAGRIRQLVGPGSQHEDEAALVPLAAALATDPASLAAEFSWITGGTATRAWALGTAMGATDLDSAMASLVASDSMGADGRLVCAYLKRRASDQGVDWLESWLDALWTRRPDRADLVLEATWRLTATERGAMRVLDIVRSGAGTAVGLGTLAYGDWEDSLSPPLLRPILYALARRADGAAPSLGLLSQRLRKRPRELEQWDDLALTLVTETSLIRSSHHDNGWEWEEVAKLLVERHAREIYRAILRAQGRIDDDGYWFLEHHQAAAIVRQCVERDPSGAWAETRPYLENGRSKALLFQVGFPQGLVDQMGLEEVIRWVEEDPEERALIIPRFAAKIYRDDTLAGRLIERYGARAEVGRIFHAELTSGPWTGRTSEHWASLARKMRETARDARGPGLLRWATACAEDLEKMAQHEREREDEERVR